MTAVLSGQDGDGPQLEPLPDVVRARVIALASEALGRVPAEALPASLKRVATFTPDRRAKLAGSRIASVLETDETFRERLAAQVRLAVPELAGAIESGSPPAAADPVEVAAVAYVLRADGWARLVAGAARVADTERAAAESRRTSEQVQRLQKQLDSLAEDLRSSRERSREQLAALKAENSDLRHKLADARAVVKQARAKAECVRAAAGEELAQATAALTAAESEARRFRARVEELERELSAVRRTERSQKGAETMRARLLLDTLLESAQGLRRELALPAVEGVPADTVEADVAEQGSRSPSGHRSLSPGDPQLLDELLRLPRVHLIVDGYNVTKTAWPDSSLEKQRERLVSGLAPLAARSGAETTVVFDAAEMTQRPPVNRPRGVRVLFSPVGVIADDVIRDLVAAEPVGRPVVVVTGDTEILRDVARAGARTAASTALIRLLART